MKLNQLEKEIKRIKSYKPYLEKFVSRYEKIIIIGNGGSNSVASHISQDYTKQLDKRCLSFSDPSRLTCYINDYGRDEAYAKFLEHFATKESLCILVSSSGNSKNIISAASHCLLENIPYIILTGFNPDNKLRSEYAEFAQLEYYVPSTDYGIVENLHSIFLHSVI